MAKLTQAEYYKNMCSIYGAYTSKTVSAETGKLQEMVLMLSGQLKAHHEDLICMLTMVDRPKKG